VKFSNNKISLTVLEVFHAYGLEHTEFWSDSSVGREIELRELRELRGLWERRADSLLERIVPELSWRTEKNHENPQ
jgi:hypothetical protein